MAATPSQQLSHSHLVIEADIPSGGTRFKSKRTFLNSTPGCFIASSTMLSHFVFSSPLGVMSSAKKGWPLYFPPSPEYSNISSVPLGFSSRPRKTSVGISRRESYASITFSSSRSNGCPMSEETVSYLTHARFCWEDARGSRSRRRRI